ncbi:MAG: nucleoside permease [Rhodothermales bacterium]|nr:nucleoside permease [Rhodothermales bacterium]MCA0268869.1 nucleoside permease [Bacteroidota bacterium]
MNIKLRLTLLNFLQFFVWGAWLISLGGYLIVTRQFTGLQVGSIYATMGIASLFMPAVAGIVADRFLNAERVYGLLHILGGVFLFLASQATDYGTIYTLMLLNAMVYMPTIALGNAVSYSILSQRGYDVVTTFPPIRVWGTIGFIVAMWMTDLLGWTKSPMQLQISAVAAIALGIYSFTLPPTPPGLASGEKKSFVQSLGLDAFVLFKDRQMLVFFVFAMLIGAALQITNTFGGAFLDDFKTTYPDSFGVLHPNLLLSISQISETVFILTIPYFLRKYGIKTVMLMSIVAWVFRFGLFAFGDPGPGLWMLVLSMIVYGMAFDFFNISGSLYVEQETSPTIRGSAQGLFMLMTNGIGAFLGGYFSGWVVDHFTLDGVKDWQSIWLSFAAYALVLALIFPFLFRYKHDPEKLEGAAVTH